MKLIIFLVLFYPSLIWGLTFKDGKQVNETILIDSDLNKQTKIKKSLDKYVIESEVVIGETYLNPIGDVNKDGVDDFVVSFSVHPESYGLKMLSVSYEKQKLLPRAPVFLYYSKSDFTYDFIKLPESVFSLRMWVIKYLEKDNRQFLVLGRNGELGMPDQIPGEENALLEFEFKNGKPVFLDPIFEQQKSTTADISLFEYNSKLNILFMNYLGITSKPRPTHKFSSVIRSLNFISGFDYSGLTPTTSQGLAINNIKVVYIDDDSNLDAIIGAEVFQDGKSITSGSYIILDFFSNHWDIEKFELNFNPIILTPKYGKNHAGFDIDVMKLQDKTYIFETSSNVGKNYNYTGSTLSIYEFSNDSVKLLNSFSLNLDKNANQSKILQFDIDNDGNKEIIVTKDRRGIYFKFINNQWEKIKFKHSIIHQSNGWTSDSVILPLKNHVLNCSRLISSQFYPQQKKPVIYLSECQ